MVKLLSLMLFFSAIVLFGTMAVNTPRHFKVAPATLYQTYNEIYFGNQLPKDIEVVAAEPPDAEGNRIIMGETEHTIGTHYYKIYISPKYNRSLQDEEESVIHESCHTYTWEQAENNHEAYGGGHGEAWQRCMLDMAKKGAFANIW